MRSFSQDLRFALRHLRRAPGFTAVVLLVIALSVGGVAALYSVLNAVVLRPAGVPEPGRLVSVFLTTPTGGAAQITVPAINLLAAQQDVFAHVAAYNRGGFDFISIDGIGEPRTIEVVGPTYFDTLGVHAVVGRLISGDDWSAQGAAPVVVVSYAFWQRQFGGRADVVGKTIAVSGRSKTIIGVTPPEFSGLLIDVQPSLSVPFGYDRDVPPSAANPSRASHLIARLKPEVTIEQARAAMAARWPAVREATLPPNVTADARTRIFAQQLHVESAERGFSTLRTQYARPLLLLVALAAVLLLVACVNLAGLLGARAAARQGEVAVRIALGAGRARLIRQFLAESLLLSFTGVVIAIPLAYWMSQSLGTTMWTGAAPLTARLTPDLGVLGAMAATACAIGAAVGMIPAWSATRGRLSDSQHTRTVSSAALRSGRVLLVAQVAFSVVLVFAGALLVRSLWRLQSVDLGFRAAGVAFARVVPRPPNGYAGLDAATYYPDLVARLAALPKVQSVALSAIFPAPIAQPQTIALVGAPREGEVTASLDTVSPRFFETMGIPLLQGRDFDWDDRASGHQVAMVSAGLARLLTSGNPIGQHVRIGAEAERADVEIIGVVGDARLSDFRAPAPLAIYRTWLQEPQTARSPIVSIRASTAAGVSEGFMRVLSSLGREYTISMLPLSDQVSRTFLQERVMAWLASAFAGLAALLTLIGVYGVLAFQVAWRRREIGVRLALGASRSSVGRLIVRDGLRLTLIGLAIGAPCALWAATYARSLLFELSPWSPGLLAVAAMVMVAIAAAGAGLPARKASSTDPIRALRCE